jgi:hypothetical protein
VRRREFITVLGMTAASWSLAARGQPKTVAKIGFVYPGPEQVAKLRSIPFLAGLASEGLREGDHFVLITRATGGDMAKVPSVLDELLAVVSFGVDQLKAACRADAAASAAGDLIVRQFCARWRSGFLRPEARRVLP